MQNTWNWAYVPWMSAIIFFVMGVGAIAVGVWARTADSYAFPVGFVLMGILFVGSAFILPTTRLSVAEDKKSLLITRGPWIGLCTRTISVPLSSACCVIFRWKYFRTGKKRIEGSIHRLLLRNGDGQDFDLFPPNGLPMRAERCGRSLAEFLQVDFRVEGDV